MKKVLFTLVVAAVCVCAAYPDKGSISFKRHVKIFEPKQRALIAWNGTEEILILSTDVHASDSTQVLEVIPMPNEPVVTKGDVEVFRKAINLINGKLYGNVDALGLKKGSEKRKASPAGEVTFHEKIGAHDISVTHVLNAKEFIDWVQEYLKKQNAENPVVSDPMRTIVKKYIADKFAWFSFDVITLNQLPKTNDAIQYRFKNDFFFYPLRISQLGEGITNIDLLLLTPKLLKADVNRSFLNFRVAHKPVDISLKELNEISTDMANLLNNPPQMKLRVWSLNGLLSSFNKDLIADFGN